MIWNNITLFIIYFIIWAFLSWPIDIQHVIAGVCVSVLVTFLTGGLFISRYKNFMDIKRYFWFFVYVILLAWEYIKGSLLVAWAVSKPVMPVNPGITEFKTGLKSEIGITFLANTITFMPGIFCIDADTEKDMFYVHCLYLNGQDMDKAIKNRVYKFEGILKKIFE